MNEMNCNEKLVGHSASVPDCDMMLIFIRCGEGDVLRLTREIKEHKNYKEIVCFPDPKL